MAAENIIWSKQCLRAIILSVDTEEQIARDLLFFKCYRANITFYSKTLIEIDE